MNENLPPTRPRSVAAWYDPFIAAAIIIGLLVTLLGTALTNAQLVVAITLVVSAYFFVSEISRREWGPRPERSVAAILDGTVTRFFGVLVGISGILVAVWLFPEYDRGSSRALIYEAAPLFLAIALPFSLLVTFITELIRGHAADGTYQFGLLARLRFSEMNGELLLNGVLEWLMRGIFVLINFLAASIFIGRLRSNGLPNFSEGFSSLVTSLDSFIFAIILLVILPGYLFASRLIGTNIKKIDRTWFGWMITLSAYSPLNAAVFTAWVTYRPLQDIYGETPVWIALSTDYPAILLALGTAIIAMAIVHLWGEAILGIRSSNLALRGIITNGPFAFTKHPVYVSKSFQWAFIFLPILNAVGILDAVRSGILFLLVCILFGARALAEERLLAKDEGYVRYALYMDRHSIFAPIGRLLPFMSFSWRYAYWKRNGEL